MIDKQEQLEIAYIIKLWKEIKIKYKPRQMNFNFFNLITLRLSWSVQTTI